MEKILQVPIIARYAVGIPLMAIGIGLTISAIIDIWNVLFGSEYYGSFWEFFDDYLKVKEAVLSADLSQEELNVARRDFSV